METPFCGVVLELQKSLLRVTFRRSFNLPACFLGILANQYDVDILVQVNAYGPT